MNLRRIFVHAIVRRLAYVLVALVLAWVGVGKAHAQTAPANACPSTASGCTETQAYASCMAAVNYTWTNLTPSQRTAWGGYRCNRNPTPKYYRCELGTTGNFYGCDSSGVQGIGSQHNIHYWSTGTCPNGISPDTGQCSLSCPGGYAEDPWNAGQCLDQQKCLARNALEGFLNVGAIATTSSSRCVGGCEYKAVGGSVCTSFGGQTECAADMDFSGNACSGSVQTKEQAVAEKDNKQQCVPAGAGQTMCIKPDGQQCYSASTGKQICWKPGETGTKTSDNYAQKRDAGNQPIPPNLNLPNGDTLTQTGTPTTHTTTNVTNNSTTNITTTTTNYVTTNGTNAGTGNQGEPGDGSGAPAGDGEGNTAGGGGSCSEPPSTSGDAILGMIATQTWKVRCAILGSGVTITGGDLADCDTPYTVTANGPDTELIAEKMRFQRASLCPDETAPADGDYMGEEGSKDGLFQDGEGGDPPGSDGLDESGFGYGATCPAIPTAEVFGVTINLDANGVFCNWMQLGGWFVVSITALWCVRGFGGVA